MTVTARTPIDASNPREGQRLELGVIAASLDVSIAEMAEAAGVGRTTMFMIATSNRWPKRADHEAIRAALRDLMTLKGASNDEIACLFHAHVSRRMFFNRAILTVGLGGALL